MFDKLDDMLIHYEELMLMLGDPDVTQDTKRFTRLMKEQADLAPIVEAYKQYKQAKQDVEVISEEALTLLEGLPVANPFLTRLLRELIHRKK